MDGWGEGRREGVDGEGGGGKGGGREKDKYISQMKELL